MEIEAIPPMKPPQHVRRRRRFNRRSLDSRGASFGANTTMQNCGSQCPCQLLSIDDRADVRLLWLAGTQRHAVRRRSSPRRKCARPHDVLIQATGCKTLPQCDRKTPTWLSRTNAECLHRCPTNECFLSHVEFGPSGFSTEVFRNLCFAEADG